MILKILGSVFIFLSSSLFGIYRVTKIKFKINNLKKIVNALEILESEIKFITPLECAAKNISELESDMFIKKFFFNIYKSLNQKLNSAQNIWLEQINLLAKKIYIEQDDVLHLKSFSHIIASLDQDLQISYLKKIILALEKKIIFLDENYVSRKKLYFNLGILFGLLIVIIFI